MNNMLHVYIGTMFIVCAFGDWPEDTKTALQLLAIKEEQNLIWISFGNYELTAIISQLGAPSDAEEQCRGHKAALFFPYIDPLSFDRLERILDLFKPNSPDPFYNRYLYNGLASLGSCSYISKDPEGAILTSTVPCTSEKVLALCMRQASTFHHLADLMVKVLTRVEREKTVLSNLPGLQGITLTPPAVVTTAARELAETDMTDHPHWALSVTNLIFIWQGSLTFKVIGYLAGKLGELETALNLRITQIESRLDTITDLIERMEGSGNNEHPEGHTLNPLIDIAEISEDLETVKQHMLKMRKTLSTAKTDIRKALLKISEIGSDRDQLVANIDRLAPTEAPSSPISSSEGREDSGQGFGWVRELMTNHTDSSIEECLSCTQLYIGYSVYLFSMILFNSCLFGLYCWTRRIRNGETRSRTEISNLKTRVNMIEQSLVAHSSAAVTVGRKIGALSAKKAKRARLQNSPHGQHTSSLL